MFNILALALFLYFMGGQIHVALIAWLFFICFLKPKDWDF